MWVERLLLSVDTGLSNNLGLHTAARLNEWKGCAHVAFLGGLEHNYNRKRPKEDLKRSIDSRKIQPCPAKYRAKIFYIFQLNWVRQTVNTICTFNEFHGQADNMQHNVNKN